MKLQLTVFAQKLQAVSDDGTCHPFAVVAEAHAETKGKAPTLLGKTEVLRNTLDPDFTKIFILHDFQLGKPMHVIVTLHDAKHESQSLGSAMFDVGAVLGTKGGMLGKQVKSGALIIVHVERTSGLGTLNLKLRGLQLKSTQEQVDPYFELQRRRKTTSGDTVWDVVYRSIPVMDSRDPLWSEACVDLGTLCGGNLNEKFRISVKDYDDSDDTLIGSCFATVHKLLNAVTKSANAETVDDIHLETPWSLKRPRPLRETGKIVVATASVQDAQPIGSVIPGEEEIEVLADGEDEENAREATGDMEIARDDLESLASFADYISGGCQLRVIVAIDFTASNGDPRKEDSLHSFNPGDGKNAYEKAIGRICTILSEYDSDQKYPVLGFGAKKDGRLSHCFAVGKEKEVEGVDGILQAYKQAFQAGIAMSKPTNIIEVIKEAGTSAQTSLNAAQKKGTLEYTIVAIFTNGNVHSVEETIAALNGVRDNPLSIVVVGVGPSSFSDMAFLQARQAKGDRVQFVDCKAHVGSSLTEATLNNIPQQLETYFQMKNIQPNPPVEPDEIVIEPFNEAESINTNITVAENGDILAVETDAKPPETPEEGKQPSRLAALGGQGKNYIQAQVKRQFGRVTKQMERNINRMIDQKVNKLFGIQNVTGKKKPTRRK